MKRGRRIALLFMTLVAVVLLFAAAEAGAACLQWGTAPGGFTGVDGCEVYETANGITVSIEEAGVPSTCYDKRGNPYVCYYWEYSIDPVPAGLSQVNIGCPSCVKLSAFQDSSVKIRDYDPSTGTVFAAGKAITLDSLKRLPGNKALVSFYTDPAGKRSAEMELKMDPLTSVQTIGPDCCNQTYAETEAIIGSGTGGTATTATFDQCTGDLTGVYSGEGVDPDNRLSALDTDLWACFADPATDELLHCSIIKKIGPETGAYLDVSGDPVIPGGPYSGTRYIGWGTTFYSQTVASPETLGYFPESCDGNAGGALVERGKTFDNVVVRYNECGDIDSATVNGNELTDIKIYLFETNDDLSNLNKANKLDRSGRLVVNAGPRHGAFGNAGIFGSFGGWGGGVWP